MNRDKTLLLAIAMGAKRTMQFTGKLDFNYYQNIWNRISLFQIRGSPENFSFG